MKFSVDDVVLGRLGLLNGGGCEDLNGLRLGGFNGVDTGFNGRFEDDDSIVDSGVMPLVVSTQACTRPVIFRADNKCNPSVG